MAAGKYRKTDAERRSLAGSALYFDSAPVPLHRAIDHRQTEPCPGLALRGKKWFHAACGSLRVHAAAGIDDFQRDRVGLSAGADRDRPAMRHRIDRIKNEV